MSRTVMVVWFLVGCASDPVRDAWHKAIRVDDMTRADGGCDAAPADSEPVEPYLFVAVARGVPDSASFYWCGTPEACGTPFANVYLTEPFDEAQLQGELATSSFEDELCLITWADVVATREGDHVELLYRAGLVNAIGAGAQVCVDLVETAVGDDCEVVLAISGTQVE